MPGSTQQSQDYSLDPGAYDEFKVAVGEYMHLKQQKESEKKEKNPNSANPHEAK